MESIVRLFKKNPYSGLSTLMIKNLFLLPSSLSKPIADTLTQPLSEQKPYIRKFDNDHWKGALIMPEIEKCDDESAIRRLINADIIIFEVHGRQS